MKTIQEQLLALGIQKPENIYYNLSYDELYQHEINPALEGFDKAYMTKSGALSVDTGIFTGRSPKDKYIVYDDETKNNVWWAEKGKKGSDNKPITPEIWNHLKKISQERLSGKNVYVMDGFCGANENSRLKIRFVTEVAWQAHFVKNMFIRPSEEELKGFEPDFVVLNSCKAVNPNWKEQGLNSEVYIAFNLTERMALIGGSWYGGEMKKGIFSVMNYFLPLKGMAAMHCSANQGKKGDTAIFFGLSGTGKTTLSTEPSRKLIGDDEHYWTDKGVVNIEGGCYAKCIHLSAESEPEIYDAIKFGTVLENTVFDDETRDVDYDNGSLTENTRASYPIHYIENIKEGSQGGHPKNIVLLTCDAFGVLPPVSKLSPDQAMFYFISGYTAKVAGTEVGVKEPQATFSACFGEAFLVWHPSKYAELLKANMEKYGSKVWLVNTGWSGGAYGVGKRMSIKFTRSIVDAIHNGSLEKAEFEKDPIFGFEVPKTCPNVPTEVLIPQNSWADKDAYVATAQKLAKDFHENFKQYDDPNHPEIAAAGPTYKG